VMPKEFAIENFTAGMSVDDIDELMAKIRDMLLAEDAARARGIRRRQRIG
jgi:hypothetical protein